MKILHVIENMDEQTGGGATERTRQLSIHFAKLGHDVTILTTSYNLTKSQKDKLAVANIETIDLPLLYDRFYIPYPFFWQVSKLIKEAEIIHIANHWTIIGLMTYFFARLYKKEYTVSPLGSLPIYGRSRYLKLIYNFLFGKRIIQNAAFSIVATLNETSAFINLGINKSKIIHIPNGINEEDYKLQGDKEFRTNLGLNDSPFILFMGRLNHIKGPDLLLGAFNKVKEIFPDLQLVYIGPDEGLLNPLEDYVASKSLKDRVHFLGFISREDKSRLINECYFLTVPSRQEAMSIVVLEAGVAGKPALITDQCGFDELGEVNGGLIVPASIDGLSEGIERMMNCGQEISKLGENLHTLVTKDYLWSSAAQKHISVFEGLIKLGNKNNGLELDL